MNASIPFRFSVLTLPNRDEEKQGPTHPESSIAEPDFSDEILVAQVCEGSREALAALFRRYARTVRGIAYKVLRDASEADDLLQDVFILVHRLCATFNPAKGSVRTWILQMAYRRAISRRRALCSRHFYSRLDLDDAAEIVGEIAGKNGGGDAILDRLVGGDALQKTFADLSVNQRETLRLFFFEGYTLAEIAERLGQTTGNVSHHYYRALEKLRKCIFGGKLAVK